MILDSFNIKVKDCVEGFRQSTFNFFHIIAAITMQLMIGLISGDWFAGACFGSAFYIGREITQAEYRVIEQFYDGKRANMPWYGGFETRAWTLKSLLDWIFPTTIVFFIACLTQVL